MAIPKYKLIAILKKLSLDNNLEYNTMVDQISEITSLKKEINYDGYFFFYGHDFEKNGTKAYFSNWFPASFKENENKFSNSEQYMMYRKATLFDDKDMAQKILNCSCPRKVKAFGRKVQNFDPKKWGQNCEAIVTQGCLLKFQQNPEMKEALLLTQQKVIVEASPYDKIWGIGLTEVRARKIDPKDWSGSNLLGKCLMKVRKILKE